MVGSETCEFIDSEMSPVHGWSTAAGPTAKENTSAVVATCEHHRCEAASRRTPVTVCDMMGTMRYCTGYEDRERAVDTTGFQMGTSWD